LEFHEGPGRVVVSYIVLTIHMNFEEEKRCIGAKDKANYRGHGQQV